MTDEHPPELWAQIRGAYTGTTQHVAQIAKAFGVADSSIYRRIRSERWTRDSGHAPKQNTAYNIVRTAATRPNAPGGRFDIAPAPGSLAIPFHQIENKGDGRQCSAILDDRPGEMDQALACGLPTADSSCPYCKVHAERFGFKSPTTAKDLTRSLRRHL